MEHGGLLKTKVETDITIKTPEKIGDVMQSAARLKGKESFLEYKVRLRQEKKVLKAYLRGIRLS